MRFKIFKKIQECMVYIHILNCHYTMFLKEEFICSRQKFLGDVCWSMSTEYQIISEYIFFGLKRYFVVYSWELLRHNPSKEI